MEEPAMSKKKILLVDDEESLCRILKLNLEGTGEYEVRTETRGTHAVAVACEFKPDLIILDFVMPDIDGGTLLNELQKKEATKSIPVIFLTAIASKDDSDDKVICGHYILAKPVAFDTLVQSIKEKLSSKG